MKPPAVVILLFSLFVSAVSAASPPGTSYCGPYTHSKPIVLNGIKDTVISGLEISNPGGICISLMYCNNVKILKCKLGPSAGCGIQLYNCTNVIINDCRIKKVSTGLYVIGSTGINFSYNQVENVQGPYPRGQMVQFNNVRGGGNRVNYNVCENILGQSRAEDAINMYETKGTSEDPVQIIGNWIRGGGPSITGGGIMAGDNGGGYIVVQDNVLVNPGQYGIGVASGTHIKVINNRIYSKKQRFTNVGLYIWNQYHSACALDTVSRNSINWTDSSGYNNANSTAWNAGNCGAVAGWDTNIYDSSVTGQILPEIIAPRCEEDEKKATGKIAPMGKKRRKINGLSTTNQGVKPKQLSNPQRYLTAR